MAGTRWRDYWAVLAVAALALLLQLAGPETAKALRYQREAILDGEVWRLLSGHLLHVGWNHLLLNLAGLLILALGFPGSGARRPLSFLLSLLVLALGTGLGLLAFTPALHWYVGLSGALHGLVALAAAGEWNRRPALAVLMLLGLAAKLGWEQLAGSPAATETLIGAPVIVDAHLWGGLCGALLALPRLLPRSWVPVRAVGPRRR